MLEELTYSQLGKFQVLTEPLQVPPMKCAGCGRYSSNDANNPLQFVDMGFQLEFHGEVFICIQGCFREIMNQVGVLTKDQTLAIEEKLEQNLAELARLKTENEELHNAVGSLSRISGNLSTPAVSVVTVAREENKPVVPAKSNPKPAGRKEGSAKPTNVGGSTGVPNDESDDLLEQI